MRCKHAKFGRYSPRFVAPRALAPPVRCSPSSLNRSSPGSLLPQLPAHRDLVLGPFKRRYTLINVPRRRGRESRGRTIRYTIVVAAAQRVQSFCSPGSASPPPVSMRASCADSKLTTSTGSSQSVLLVMHRKPWAIHDLSGVLAHLIPRN